jgi:hypothetical protein
VVGGAAALLRPRTAAFAAVALALGLYYAFYADLWSASLWWDVAWLDLVLIPVVFALPWLALPFWRSRGLVAVAAACALAAVALHRGGAPIVADFAKLAAVTFFAWWFLSFFETIGWVVLVACIIPFVDAYSVWRGPTNDIVHHRQQLFSALSFAFPVPGSGGAVANLGLPDLLFFALFLAASVRFRLRPGWTWLAMVVSFGATMALAVAFDVGGLPALPGLSIAFLAVNADLIRRQLRPR